MPALGGRSRVLGRVARGWAVGVCGCVHQNLACTRDACAGIVGSPWCAGGVGGFWICHGVVLSARRGLGQPLILERSHADVGIVDDGKVAGPIVTAA